MKVLQYIFSKNSCRVYHRRRKILKVGGAEYPIAREARAKILRPRPLHVKPRPFLHDRGCYHEFLGEKINCKSSRIDLVAIEAYLLIIRPGKCLKIFIVTILGWRTMGALPPFLKYWGGYSPLSPPGSYAYVYLIILLCIRGLCAKLEINKTIID